MGMPELDRFHIHPNLSATFYRYPEGAQAPFFDRGLVQEQKSPWRYGIGRIWRMPFTRWCIVLIEWTGRHEEEETEDGRFLSMRELDDWKQIVENFDEVIEEKEDR